MSDGGRRDRWARGILWLGVLAPFLYTTPKTITVIQSQISVLDTIRGAGPTACWVVAMLIQPQAARQIHAGLAGKGMAWFLAVAVASSTWSVDPRSTLLKTIPLIFSVACLHRLARMYPTFTDAATGLFHLVHLILVGTVAQLVLIPSQAYSGSLGDPIPRVHSVVPNIPSNLFGLVAAAGLVSILCKVGPRWATRGLVSTLLFVGYAGLLIGTRSRVVTAVTVLVCVIALVHAMRRTRRAAALGWFTITAATAAAAIAFNQPRLSAAVEAFILRGQSDRAVSTLTGRIAVWERALPVWQEQPMQGYGYYAGHRIGLAQRFNLFERYSNLDSTWIESLVNVGLIGTAGLLVFALAGFRNVMSAATDRRTKTAAVLLTGACLVMSFVNPGIQSTTPTLLLFGALVYAARPTVRVSEAPAAASCAPSTGSPLLLPS